MNEPLQSSPKLTVVNSLPKYNFQPSTSSPFVNDYIAWRNSESDAASEYAEALALATLSVIVGPNLKIPLAQEARPVPCNLYILLLGDSTTARKSSSQKAAKALIEDTFSSPIIETPGSPEGFVQDLADHELTGSVLFQDEFAGWFASLQKRSYMSQLREYILSSYDGDRIARRLRTKRNKDGSTEEESDIATAPVFSFIANGTPDRIAMLSSTEDIETGWWARWACIWPAVTPPYKSLTIKSKESEGLRQKLVNYLVAARRRLKMRGSVSFTDECWPYIDSLQTRTRSESKDELLSIYERSIIRTIKVATLLAFSEDVTNEGDVLVQLRHVEEADNLVSSWTNSTIRFADKLGNNQFENWCMRAVEKIKRSGGQCDLRTLSQLIKQQYRTMVEIGSTLEMRGLVTLSPDKKTWHLGEDA